MTKQTTKIGLLSAMMALSNLLVLSCSFVPQRTNTCIEFGSPFVLGQKYGAPAGQLPGSALFTTAKISIRLQNFVVPGSTQFNSAYTETPSHYFSSPPALRLNNISIEFDFSNLTPSPSHVTFAFLDLGGIENLSINGTPAFVGDIGAAPTSLSGAGIKTSKFPVHGGAVGKFAATGPIQSLLIGGQELWIDLVCAE